MNECRSEDDLNSFGAVRGGRLPQLNTRFPLHLLISPSEFNGFHALGGSYCRTSWFMMRVRDLGPSIYSTQLQFEHANE